jgi:hypothetical protein
MLLSRFASLFLKLGIVLSFVFGNIVPVQAALPPQPPVPNLFDYVVQQADGGRLGEIAAVRQQPIHLNLNLLDVQADRLSDGKIERRLGLPLFDGQFVTAVLDHQEITPTGGLVFSGVLEGLPGGTVTISRQGEAVVGNLVWNEGFYRIISSGGGQYQLRQIDPALFPDEEDKVPEGFPAEPEGFSSIPAPDSGSPTIDVMVLYTPKVTLALGGTSAAQALVNLAINETNQGYTNSQVNQRVQLVYQAEVNYTEPSSTDDYQNWSRTLDRLTTVNDGYIDQIHTWRDTYGADEVVLLTDFENSSYCGLSWLMTTPSAYFASSAFAVVEYSCATGYYSFAHEMGHNMGAHHDRYSSGGSPGAYSYSHGYYPGNKAWRTIMSYNCPNKSCTRVNYWSNPNVKYSDGQAMGVSASDLNNSADNHLTLNNTAAIVAAFKTPLVVNPIPGVSGVAPSYGTVGSGDLNLVVAGQNFINGAVVRWNGTNLTTSFQSGTQLTAVVPAKQLTATGSAKLTVFNPAPGGGLSSELVFPIYNPTPVLGSMWPSSLPAGVGDTTLYVYGSSFLSGAVVRWNGTPLTTTFLNAGALKVILPKALLAVPNTALVSVANPAPVLVNSVDVAFVVGNPIPVLKQPMPKYLLAAAPADLTISVIGQNFLPSSVVKLDNSDLSATFVSATQINVVIPASMLVQPRLAGLVVFNPAPVGGYSQKVGLPIYRNEIDRFVMSLPLFKK